MSEEIFNKILNETATDEEKLTFFESIKNDPEKRKTFIDYKNIYIINSYNDKLYEQKTKESFNQFWKSIQPKKAKRTIYSWLQYAAVFIAAVTILFSAHYFLSSKYNQELQQMTYSTKKGSVSEIKLNDGSSIWLNSCTNLTIKKFRNGETSIKLDGEAYFDLLPDKNRKLTIDIGYFKIHDIGTKFNVRAYSSENEILTNLIEGQINFTENSGDIITSIKPGEIANFNIADKKMKISRIDPQISTAWKDGKFVFIDKTLEEICSELKNWYDVDIIIDDPQLAKTHYTSVVKRSTTIQLVLKMLNITDKVHYVIKDQPQGKDIIHIKK
jgi:transmembrane sensor